MTDTTNCANCGAAVPSAASFCTSCGHAVTANSGEPAGASPEGDSTDVTRVDTPGLHDSTQVLSPVTPSAATGPPPDDAASPNPPEAWSPGPSSTPPPTPPSSWDAPPTAAPAPPTWQQPPPAQNASGWGAPPTAGPPPSWAPPAQAGPGTWGATPAGAGPTSTAKGSPLGSVAAIVGGALTIVGLFTTWVTGDRIEASGWDLTKSGSELTSKDPYILLALAVGAVLLGVVLFTGALRPVVRAAVIVVGLAIVALHVRDWLSIVDVVKNNPAFDGRSVDAGFGFYLGIAGGAVTALSGLLPARKR